MFLLAFMPVQQVQIHETFANRLANGVEAREVYQNDRLVAQGIEVTESVNGGQHFFSHAESIGTTTEVQAWTDAKSHPTRAQYSLRAGDFWITTSVETDGDKVRMVRESSQPDLERTFTATLQKGRTSILAQFDPLRYFPDSSIGKSIDVSVIDPVAMSVVDAKLVEEDAGPTTGQTRMFELSTASSSSQMAISSQGHVTMVRNTAGQTYKPVPWNNDLVEMAGRAGIRLDPAILASAWQTSTQVSVSPKRGRG